MLAQLGLKAPRDRSGVVETILERRGVASQG
jgi:hypothetical protein